MMRLPLVSCTLLLCTAALAGCTSADCLPEPSSDETPPELSLTVVFTDGVTGERAERTFTAADASAIVEAVAGEAVEVSYAGADAEGVRRVHLGATLHQTVSVGSQRRTMTIAPLVASCPQPRLESAWTYARAADSENLVLGLVAENWSGLRTGIPSVTVRLRPPAPEAAP